jgi:hypothetical protein
MSIFSGIENAKSTEGGAYLTAGVYDVEVIRLTVGKTRKGVPFFAADMKVIGSNNPEHRPGEVRNWFVGMDKDAALGNIKGFAVACLSSEGAIDPASVTEQVMESLVDKGGEAVVGTRLKVQVTAVPTKSGGTYSKHLWFPLGTAVAASA